MFKEFKEFAMRGNVLDLAVGVIIGAAFGRIVTSLVNDIIMPPIGMAMGGIDFKDYFIALRADRSHVARCREEGRSSGHRVWSVSEHSNQFPDRRVRYLSLVKQVNRFQKPAAVTTKDCPFCFSSIPLKAIRCPNCTSVLEGWYSDL